MKAPDDKNYNENLKFGVRTLKFHTMEALNAPVINMSIG